MNPKIICTCPFGNPRIAIDKFCPIHGNESTPSNVEGKEECIVCGKPVIKNAYCSDKSCDGYIETSLPEGASELVPRIFPFEHKLVGKNIHSVLTVCPECRTHGINMPLEKQCGNCGYTETRTYYDAETIQEMLNSDKQRDDEIRELKESLSNTEKGYEIFRDKSQQLQPLLKEKEDEVKELKDIIKQLTEDFAVGIQQRDETIREKDKELEELKEVINIQHELIASDEIRGKESYQYAIRQLQFSLDKANEEIGELRKIITAEVEISKKYKALAEAAEAYIKASPCDPDITPEQIEADNHYQTLKQQL